MLALSLLTFLSFGVTLVLVGANQAWLARDLSLDLAATGLLASSLAVGAGLGVTAAGPLFDRVSRRRLLAASCMLVAVALGSMHAEASFAGAALRLAAAGMGAGGYNTIINAGISEARGRSAARALAAVHSAATIGAMAGPIGLAWLAEHAHWAWSFRLVGLAHGVVGLLALALWPDRTPTLEAAAPAPEARRPWGALAPFLVIAFCYVGIEATATAFAVPYAVEHLELEATRGQLAISTLWLGVLVSRVGLFALPRLGPVGLVVAGAAGAAVVAGLGDIAMVELFFGVLGAAIGLTYPLVMTLVGERFAAQRGTAAGAAGGAGAVGAVFIPWLAGAVGDALGTARVITVLGVACVVIAVAGVWLARSSRRAAASP